jgi:hypothetical protein
MKREEQMTQYFRRYFAGEREAVWDELVNQGPDVRAGGVASEAASVCREVIDRCYKNLVILRDRLDQLGYRFQNPHNCLVEATRDDMAILNRIEKQMGLLPMIARFWYERFRSVDFEQDPAQMRGENGPDQVAGLGFSQTLTFLSLENCLKVRDTIVIEAKLDNEDTSYFAHFLPTGGTASNCDPKGFKLPNPAIDGVLYNAGFGDVLFLDDLREAFFSGGFPYWRHYFERRRRLAPVRATPDFVKLMPVLCDGLLPI